MPDRKGFPSECDLEAGNEYPRDFLFLSRRRGLPRPRRQYPGRRTGGAIYAEKA